MAVQLSSISVIKQVGNFGLSGPTSGQAGDIAVDVTNDRIWECQADGNWEEGLKPDEIRSDIALISGASGLSGFVTLSAAIDDNAAGINVLSGAIDDNAADIITLSANAGGSVSGELNYLSGAIDTNATDVGTISGNYVTTDTIQTITAQKTISQCSLSDPTLQKLKMGGGVNVNGSAALGNVTSALVDGSMTAGWRTRTDKMWQTVIGAWNEDDLDASISGAYPFIVGNGSDENNRSNAFIVGYDGSIFVQTSAKIQDFIEVNGGKNYGSLSADPGIVAGDTYYNTVSGRQFIHDGLGAKTLATLDEIDITAINETYASTKFVSLTANNQQINGSKRFNDNVDIFADNLYTEADFTAVSGGTGGGSGRVKLNSYGGTVTSGATVMGLDCQADAPWSFAHGEESVANSPKSHAEGYQCQTLADFSHAEGNSCIVMVGADASHAEGYQCQTNGNSSHAEGEGANAAGDSSHAEGRMTTANGAYSHSEGEDTQADGDASHAEGFDTLAAGEYSHAEGSGTFAIGVGAHAQGIDTVAFSDYSYAMGEGTETAYYGQAAMGRFNILDPGGLYSVIIGNGLNSGSRSNAFAVGIEGFIEWGSPFGSGAPTIRHYGASNGIPPAVGYVGGPNDGDRYFDTGTQRETIYTATSGWIPMY